MNTFPLPTCFSTWKSFDNCSLDAGRNRRNLIILQRSCGVLPRDKMLAVCFLSYFPQWEMVTTYTDNCSLDAGRIDA